MCIQKPEDDSNSHPETLTTDDTLKEYIDELENEDITESEENDYESNRKLTLSNFKDTLDEKSQKIEVLETDFKNIKSKVTKLSDDNRAWLAIKIAVSIGVSAILISTIIGMFALFFSFHGRIDLIYQHLFPDQSNTH